MVCTLFPSHDDHLPMPRLVCVICYPGQIGCVTADDMHPCILTFDSISHLSSQGMTKIHQTLREYLSCEWKTKINGAQENVFSKENMVGVCPEVQLQHNGTDCGVYLIQYIESFFTDTRINFRLPICSLKELFTTEMVEKKRNDIASLIRKLAKEQNPGKVFEFPKLNFN